METRQSSRRLQMQSLLLHLSHLVEKQITTLKRFSHTEGVEDGPSLCALPDELLQLIFVLVGQENAIALSQVNTRIRSITLHTSELWTTICNLQPRAHIDASMRCAGHVSDARLSLSLRERRENLCPSEQDSANVFVDFPQFMRIISPLRVNWETVRVEHCRPGDFNRLRSARWHRLCLRPSISSRYSVPRDALRSRTWKITSTVDYGSCRQSRFKVPMCLLRLR